MKEITAVLLCLCLVLCCTAVFAEENAALIEFKVSDADANGVVTAMVIVKNASFQVVQATVSYDPGQFAPEEGDFSRTKLGTPVADTEEKQKLLSPVKIEHIPEKGEVTIVGMTNMSYQGDKYKDDRRNIIADETGIEFFSVKFKKLSNTDAVPDIKDVALASDGKELTFKMVKQLPGKEDVVETFVPEVKEPEKTEQEKRNERMKDMLILQISNYAAVDDGELCWIDSENKSVMPYIKNSRTMIPLRFVAERMGLEVSWNAEEQKITMTGTGTELVMIIGNDQYTKNGETFKMDAAPELTEAGRTFVPLRVIAEAFGQDVTWYAQQSCVVIVPESVPWDEENKTEQKLLQDALLIMSPLIRDLK